MTPSCHFCGETFEAQRIAARYCSDSCRAKAFRQARESGANATANLLPKEAHLSDIPPEVLLALNSCERLCEAAVSQLSEEGPVNQWRLSILCAAQYFLAQLEEARRLPSHATQERVTFYRELTALCVSFSRKVAGLFEAMRLFSLAFTASEQKPTSPHN